MNVIFKAIGAIYIFELAYCSYNLSELSPRCVNSFMDDRKVLEGCYKIMNVDARFKQLKAQIEQAYKANQTLIVRELQTKLTCCVDYAFKPVLQVIIETITNCSYKEQQSIIKDYDNEVSSGLITNPLNTKEQLNCTAYPPNSQVCPQPLKDQSGGGANSILVTNSMVILIFVVFLGFI